MEEEIHPIMSQVRRICKMKPCLKYRLYRPEEETIVVKETEECCQTVGYRMEAVTFCYLLNRSLLAHDIQYKMTILSCSTIYSCLCSMELLLLGTDY